MIAPGSPGYTWHAEAPLTLGDIPVMPTGIIPETAPGDRTGHWKRLDRDDLEPQDLAALQALEALGGHHPYVSGSGYTAITRPGKEAGGSASIGHIGPGIVKVYSPHWLPLVEGGVYDADQLRDLAGIDDQHGGAGRRAMLTPASMIQPRPVFWLWEGRLALGTLAYSPAMWG